MTKITVRKPTLESPAWGPAPTAPGGEWEMNVSAPRMAADDVVEFRVFHLVDGKNHDLAVLTSKPGDVEAKWKVTNLPGDVKVKFDARLRAKPSPANGFATVLAKTTSVEKAAKWGYKVSFESGDDCFVPKQEELNVKFKVEDPSGAAKKGRIEIWGERYPSEKPLYTEDFTPANGSKEWKTWKGEANAGVLKDDYDTHFITPEFSPYRVRVVIGPDAESVGEPDGKGLGLVATAEREFQVVFQRIEVLLQEEHEIPDATINALLKIEKDPHPDDGTFDAEGRLPKPADDQGNVAEKARIRVPCKRFRGLDQKLAMGGKQIAHGYQKGGDNKLKWNLDRAVYTRPEIPVEFKAYLKSRDTGTNQKGLFEKEAVGPALFDVLAEDSYAEALYGPLVNGGGGNEEQEYLYRSAHFVKRGKHDTPHNPVVTTYWKQRFEIPNDDENQELTFDLGRAYVTGKNTPELTVYLNRAKLLKATDNTFKDGDYHEESATKIKLKPKSTRQDDVVWVMRSPQTPYGGDLSGFDAAANKDGVAKWDCFPLGDNCHVHYGGIGGNTADTGNRPHVNTLLGTFSGAPGGTQPILGKSGTNDPFPYKDGVRLNPDRLTKPEDSERVEAQAYLKDDPQGKAGVVFSPSYVAGDSYVLVATLRGCPYDRDLGEVVARPQKEQFVQGKTGTLSVWRTNEIIKSMRRPTLDGNGPAQDGDPAGRAYRGSGRRMDVHLLNRDSQNAFNEWTVTPADHENINLNTYNATQTTGGVAGMKPLPSLAHINEYFVRQDHYRVRVPPEDGTADAAWINSWDQEIGDAIHDAENCRKPEDVMNDVDAAITAELGTPMSPAMPAIYTAGDENAYKVYVKGFYKKVAYKHLDVLTPQRTDAMQVVRWDEYAAELWSKWFGTMSHGCGGFCRGNGQSFFVTATTKLDTFQHEMGHALNLTHLVTGSMAAWKHHDTTYGNCKMSYNNKGPHAVPAAVPAIQIQSTARAKFCGKCLLKMRGWKEHVLPCNWANPSVF